MRSLPSQEGVVADLSPLLPALYEAFEHGAGVAQQLFEEWGFKYEPHAFSTITRLHAGQLLDQRGGRLPGYQRISLANCGLYLVYGSYQIRCWKATDGDLPDPKSSVSRRYWRQLPMELEASKQDAASNATHVNLIVQWELEPKSGVVELTLVCPKPGTTGPESVDAEWVWPIPHPSEMITAQPVGSAEDNDTDDLEIIRVKAPRSASKSS